MSVPSTDRTSNGYIDLGRYVHPAPNPLPQPQQQQPPGFWSRIWSGTQHYVYSPARQASEEAVQGFVNRFSDLFAQNQEEITNRIQEVFAHALVRRCPENYYRLLLLIRSFLNNPSQGDLDQIKPLLNGLNGPEILALAPRFSDAGIQQLTTLKALLDKDVTVQPSITVETSPTLTVSLAARERLQIAEGLLCHIIENYEGTLIQISNLLNDPQHGIIARGLNSLRHGLNARPCHPLKQTKDTLEAYRSALARNASSDELLPLIRALYEKLQLLMTQRDLVPQINPNQWEQLEQFDHQLQVHLSSREPFSIEQQLLAQSDIPCQILTSAFNAQCGIIVEAVDILVDGMTRGVRPFVELPRRMYQDFYSLQPLAPQPPSPHATPVPATPPAISSPETSNSAPAQAESFLNLNQIALQGRRLLDSVLASASGALSQQTASSLATLVRYTFEKIREHIQHSQEQSHLLGTIDPMITRLQGATQNGSWGELISVLQSAFQFMGEQQVYLQGLRLPLNPVRTHVSAIPDFLQNLNAHQNTLQPPSQRTLQNISDTDISQKAELLKGRASSLGPAKLVLEKICGIEASDTLYANIYRASDTSGKDIPSIFRERLFDKIDQANLGFFSAMIKWSAKRVYDLTVPLFSFYMNSTFDNVLNLVKDGIKSRSPSGEPKEELFIKVARNWLSITSAAYNQVASAPASQTKDLTLMMEQAIKSPEHNGGLKQKELYAAVAKTVIDSFGPQIKWNETIDQYFNTQIPKHSPLYFLNPLVNSLNSFCSTCLKTMVFIPQWVGNLILQQGAKMAISHSPFLKNYSKQSIESLRSHTPVSYAIQQMLYRQLQKIVQLLHQSLSDDADEGLRPQDTNATRIEITSLVEYLMEVLNKSQYPTKDRLSNYLQHHAPIRNRMSRELEDTFIPEVMEDIVMILSIVLKAATQESELQQTVYDTLCVANDSFEVQEPVSDEDFVAVERGIKELTDQILETTIFHAIDGKFDFTNEKQKRGVHDFVQTMKAQSQMFATQINQNIQEASGSSISTRDFVSRISSMIECSSHFNRDRVEALGKADGNRDFHTETKYHLNELSRTLLSHCTPIAQQLNNMKNIADELISYEKWLPPLFLSIPINRTLGSVLQNQRRLSSQDLTLCNTQLALLESHLAILRSCQCPLPLIDSIQQHYREFRSALQKIEELQKEESVFRRVFPLFTRLKQEKLLIAANLPSNTLRQLESQLCDSLNTLSNTDHKNQLVQQVLTLMLASNNESVEAAASHFSELYIQFNANHFAQADANLAHLREINAALQTRFNNAIQEFSHQITVDKSGIHHLCSEMRNRVNELDRWAQAQHDLPIWNLFIFDMQWVTETVKNLAFDRAQSKIKQLFESSYQRYNYFGFVNQVLLLPFLEKFGKHHLKPAGRTVSTL